MRHIVDRFRTAIASRPGRAGPIPGDSAVPLQPEIVQEGPDIAAEADRLYQELLRLYGSGSIAEAAETANRLAEIKRKQFGDRHPEYATALCHRALLLQNLGKLKEAEAGLRTVLEIRREALGRHNPLLAMTLSQLAMLLVETGKWNDAEAALIESVSIRSLLLGENHPNVASDLRMLEMLAERRRQAETPSSATFSYSYGPETQASITQAVPNAQPGMELVATGLPATIVRDAKTIKEEIRSLAGILTRIGSGMESDGRKMMTQGLPPDPRLLFDATTCQRQFAALCDEAARRAEALDLDTSRFLSSGRDRFSLPDLTMLFEEILRLESKSADISAGRAAALAIIGRILSLTHSDPDKSVALHPVLALAESLRSRVKNAKAGRPDAEVVALTEGSHPLVALDRLTSVDDVELDDETWTKDYETIAASQGKRFAAAAARRRLKPQAPAQSPFVAETPFDSLASSRSVTDLMDSVLDGDDILPERNRGSREAVLNRIVIPETTVRKPVRPVRPPQSTNHPSPPPAAAPAPTPLPAPAPAEAPEARMLHRPKTKDDYTFLRSQTSIISQ